MEVVKQNLCKYTGEGPYWDERSNELFLLDISLSDEPSTIFRWNTVTDEMKSFSMDRATTFNIPCTDSDYSLISIKRHIFYLNWTKNKGDEGFLEKLTEVHKGDDVVRFNDGKCDKNGILFAGTMSEEKSPGVLWKERAGMLFRYDSIHEPEVQDSGIQLSNGIDWNSNGDRMYFVDSVDRKIIIYEYDAHSSKVVKRIGELDYSIFPELNGQLPDGITIDINDHLWVTNFFGGNVVQFDMTNQKILQNIKGPTACTTSCCFGGPNLTDMYVTSSTNGINNDPSRGIKDAGSLMKIPGSVHGTKGVFMNKFKKT